MKKLLAITLSLVFCLTLLTGALSATAEETAGDKGIAMAIVPSMDAVGLIMIMDKFGADMEAAGYTYEIKDGQGDNVNYVNYMENAVTDGNVKVLMVAAMDVEAIQDACENAMEAGIKVLMLGAMPEEYTIDNLVITSYALTGYYAADAILAWIAANPDLEKNAEGLVPVAANTYYDILDGSKRSNAFVNAITESGVAYIDLETPFYGDTSITDGYNFAETAMTRNPGLRVFFCYEPDAMEGVTSYLAEYATDNGLDLKDFCVINCYEDDKTAPLLEQATADPSSTAFKGYVTYGTGPEDTGATLAMLALGSLDGTYPRGYKYIDEINAYTNYGYSMKWVDGDETPIDPF